MGEQVCYNGNCIEKYGSLFSPRLVEIFKYAGWPPQYILDIVEENCTDTRCRHHVFSDTIRWGHPGEDRPKIPQEWTDDIRNCLCLVPFLLDEGPNCQQIADAFGVSHQAVEKTLNKGLAKLRKNLAKEEVVR